MRLQFLTGFFDFLGMVAPCKPSGDGWFPARPEGCSTGRKSSQPATPWDSTSLQASVDIPQIVRDYGYVSCLGAQLHDRGRERRTWPSTSSRHHSDHEGRYQASRCAVIVLRILQPDPCLDSLCRATLLAPGIAEPTHSLVAMDHVVSTTCSVCCTPVILCATFVCRVTSLCWQCCD